MSWKDPACRVRCILLIVLYFCWLSGLLPLYVLHVSGVQRRGLPAADWDGAAEPPGRPPAEESDGRGRSFRHPGADVWAQDALGKSGWEDHQPTGQRRATASFNVAICFFNTVCNNFLWTIKQTHQWLKDCGTCCILCFSSVFLRAAISNGLICH